MRLRNIVLLVTFALGLLAAPLAAAEAQQAVNVPRIGFMAGSSAAAVQHWTAAFRQGLRELGYVEGQNIVIEWRFAEGKQERFPELVSELVRLKVDVIVVVPTPAALAAKEATRTIPIVTVGVSDPVGSGLVASLARPGGNVTGLSIMGIELVGKQLELLKEAFPRISRVAVLYNPASQQAHAPAVKEAERAARLLGVQLQVLETKGPEDFDRAFSTITRERAGALLVLADPMFFLHRARLAELAAKNQLPAIYGVREHAEAGGLMAYATNMRYNSRRAAVYVDKILKGAKPADLPVEQPMKFELVINCASRES